MPTIRQITLARGPRAAEPVTTAQELAHAQALIALGRYQRAAENDAALCIILRHDADKAAIARGSARWIERHAFPHVAICGNAAQLTELRATLATA